MSQQNDQKAQDRPRVMIVGAGFAGLGMAIALQNSGIHDFVILEKANDVGGTWRDNSYPGCRCDIPSQLYSFSFAPNPDWTQSFATQAEIQDYLCRLTDGYELRPRIRFGMEVTGAQWDEDQLMWRIETRSGEQIVTQFVIFGIGALNIPFVPTLPGMNKFTGQAFHSAKWEHKYELRGKKVAVIGSGASAIQFIPHIAAEVDQLILFQRTPPWVLPKANRLVPCWTRFLFRQIPLSRWIYRTLLYWLLELRGIGFYGLLRLLAVGEWIARRHLAKHIEDGELRSVLTPNYRMGCKRVLFSDDYYPALNRKTVEVIATGVGEIREHSIVSTDGREYEVDAIIFGTGFRVSGALSRLNIIGRQEHSLTRQWLSYGPQAYLGVMVSGFPNLFFLLGPNSGLGHNSVIFMIESQIGYIVRTIKLMDSHAIRALDVRSVVQERFNGQIQRKLGHSVWTQGGCTSWYLDRQGVNRALWPGSSWRYWLRMRRIRLGDFQWLSAP